jgi:starch synthase
VWDPAHDPHLPAPYDARKLAGKARCKAALQERLGLAAAPRALLFGVVSRLTEQKGLDLVLAQLPALLARGGQLALLGSGQAWLEAGFAAAAQAHPGRVGIVLGYDEGLAHLIQGGADAILVPSRFEPCGLTQLCGLRYGTVPIVARVGGLADTVIDANEAALADGVATGFQFAPVSVEGLAAALDRAFALWAEPRAWQAVQRRGMSRDVGWGPPAARYRALYESLLAARKVAA